MKKVNVLYIGLGARGYGYLKLLLQMEDVEILGVSDLYADRAEKGAELVESVRGKRPAVSTSYRDLLDIKGLDCVIAPASWTSHAAIALDAMNAGLYAGIEVGGASSIEECWELIRTSERTGKPCMMLENCCYGREEMTVLNMIRKGMFGELVHCEGGYRHDLRDEVALGHENRHYRLDNYLNRTGDVYPTHELGPIAKYLGLNRGNRMVSLTSTASKSVGINDWIKRNKGEDFENAHSHFALGDVVITVIKCAHGETITLYHDTSLPRPYSRANLVQGTRGIWSEDKRGVYIDGRSPHGASWDPHCWESIDDYFGEFEHPLWREYRDAGVKAGHGGMDYLVQRAFIEAVRDGVQTPIDVYDTASWMAVTPLSEASINCGSAPVAIPDFTNGRWINREAPARGKYCLDEVCTEAFAGDA